MKNKKKLNEGVKNNKGITLIALVITIIVLLILAGVSIATLTGENGILTQAENAKEQTDEAGEKEAIALAYNGAMAETEGKSVTAGGLNSQFNKNGIKATASGEGTIKVEFETGRSYIVDAYGNVKEYIDIAKYVKVGDYVNYNPTVATKDGNTKVETSKLNYRSPVGTATEHGNGESAQTFTATADTKWRILNIKEDRTVELISENIIKTDSDTNFILSGAIGYLYAEQELNEVCKIFGYGYGADTTKGGSYTNGGPLDNPIIGRIEGTGARSITIEDINKLAGITEENYTTLNNNYGRTTDPTSNVYYPTVDTTKGNSATGESTSAGAKNLKYTQYNYSKSKIENTTVQNILFNGKYWLASRCISTGYKNADFYVYRVNGDYVNANELCSGDSTYLSKTAYTGYAVRPIVTLKSNIIDVKTSTEYNGVNMWSLK